MKSFCEFTDCPPLGTKIVNRRSEYVLIDVEDYIRKSDGKASNLLFWERRSEEGRILEIVCTGLKSKWPTKMKKYKMEWVERIQASAKIDPFS